jgi:hypothetical protein
MTKRTPPDPLTLDRMVLGTDDGDDLSAWSDLLASPDASTAWAVAVERRQRVDALAFVVAGQPWLAPLMLAWRRVMRRAPPFASWSAEVRFASQFAVSLTAPDRRDFKLRQGATEVLELILGETVSVSLPPGATLRQVTRLGVLPTSLLEWTLEAGEAPVVLLAARASDGALMATLVLVEAQKEKTAP